MALKCPSCGAKNPEGQKLCGECDASMSGPPMQGAGVLKCPNCGFANPEGRRYCSDCGSMIPRTPRIGASAQRRRKKL